MTDTQKPQPRGWYNDPANPDQCRYWTGTEWGPERAMRTIPTVSVPRKDRAADSTAYILCGFLLIIGGGWLINSGLTGLGALIAAAGTLTASIGVIAKGVQIGMRDHKMDFQ